MKICQICGEACEPDAIKINPGQYICEKCAAAAKKDITSEYFTKRYSREEEEK